jgi:putative ABC transport system permease protein
MNLFKISWSYLRYRPLNTTLTLALLALGVGILAFLLLAFSQVQSQFSRNIKGIDLVIGAKGSPLQLILSSVYHADNPTGNIYLSEIEQLSKNKLFVKKAIPLSLGDSYQGFRIVGTEKSYAEHYQASLAQGRWWQSEMEVVLGADVAQSTALGLDSLFAGAHGLGGESEHFHEEVLYRVVGVMAPTGTVLDRLLLTATESVWKVHESHDHEKEDAHEHHEHEGHEHEAHEHHEHEHEEAETVHHAPPRQITAMLIQYKSPQAAIQMPRMVNEQSSLQAAVPANELSRLFSLLGVGVEAFNTVAYLLMGIAVLSIFIALYQALRERRYDLALMRSLGASPGGLLQVLLLESLLVTLSGIVLGLLMAHGALALVGQLADNNLQFFLKGNVFLWEELYLAAVLTGLAVLVSLLPALQVYRLDIAKVLSE